MTRRYSIRWESPYDRPGTRPRTLTLRARNKVEALKAHDRLFPARYRKVTYLGRV